jgi:phosphoenolpyruvate carboxykinase (GTP)
MRKRMSDCPRVFHVNWFRRDEHGRFLWPGFGQNMRVLKWIFERCTGEAGATETSLGLVPQYDHLDWSGLEFDSFRFSRIMDVQRDEWEAELNSHDALFRRLGDKRPDRLMRERDRLAGRIAM